MWYEQAPTAYAGALRYYAERSDESATFKRQDGKPWSAYEAAYMERQARRLRAMAVLCDRSTAARAGDVDFRRLNDPSVPREQEEAVVAEILATAVEHAGGAAA